MLRIMGKWELSYLFSYYFLHRVVWIAAAELVNFSDVIDWHLRFSLQKT